MKFCTLVYSKTVN